MDDLLQEFIAETRETLEALAGAVVAWEADPGDRANLDAIFRFVHTVKGSCGFLNLARLARLSHAAEDALATVRDGKRTPDAALVNAVLAIVDRIGELVEAMAAGTGVDAADEDRLIAAVAGTGSSPGAAPAAATAPVAPPAAAPPLTIRAPRGGGRSIRLNVDLLDRMMGGMSDMVLARNELARRLRDGTIEPQVEAALDRLSATVADMRDAVTRTRMQRIEGLFGALPRVVRDTAGELGKKVALTIEGGDVELDREMIELLRDPLTHMVRNAVDHGIEHTAGRRAAGKPETGRLVVSARQAGNQILVEISDDGAGIDTARIVAKALRIGLHGEAEVAAMTEAQRLDLIFAPGLSSRDEVTAISGRGVGMDVVRANIEQIGGRVALGNDPGRGLTVVIQVPLTLSIIAAVIVGAGSQRFALPRQVVEEVVPLCGAAVRLERIGGTRIAAVRGERLPVVGLADALGIAAPAATMLAIVTTRDGRFALAIDAVADAEDLVVKPVAPAVMTTGLFAGQTLPDTGVPMLLLDAAGIAAHEAIDFAPTAAAAADEVAEGSGPTLPALLFDDLDGCRRAVALAAIDRVERIAAGSIRLAGGRHYLVDGDALLPLQAAIEPSTGSDVVVLRLNDGDRHVGYLVADPIDIIDLPLDRIDPVGDGRVAGLAVVDGEPVELIDAHALFAQVAAPAVAAPLCLLHDDGDGWMSGFLRPTLEAAGYRCTTRLAPGESAAVALALDGSTAAPDLPTIHLSRSADAGGAAIYRYDRPALIDALSRHVAGRRGS